MIRAGFAIADITPRGRRSDLCGFAARIQPSTRVAAPIGARVLLLDDGRARVIVAVCDTLGFRQADSLRLERAMARAGRMPARNVFLTCTHQHSGPMSIPLGRVGRFVPSYLDVVERGLVAAVRAATEDLQPVTRARFGEQSIPGMAEYRCCREEPGRARWPGVVTALRLERGRSDPITLFHAGIHPYVLGWRSRVMHPDFPLPACEALPGRAMFLPGCGADVSPVPSLTTKIGEATRYGRKLARAVERALARGRAVTLDPLRICVATPRVRFGFLPVLPKPDRNDVAKGTLNRAEATWAANQRDWECDLKAGRLPRVASFRMHGLRLGDVVFIGIPAEVFGQTGLDLRPAVVVSHAGGNWGYLPRPFSYKHQTYESSAAHQWYRTAGGMVPGTETDIRRVAQRMAQRLTGTQTSPPGGRRAKPVSQSRIPQ